MAVQKQLLRSAHSVGTTRRARARAYGWLMALSLAIIGIYCAFFIVFLGRTGPRDADQFLVFHSLQYWNATMFGLDKQWTPLMCAGLSMAGEPQIPFMSLSMCLSYLLGPYWGLKTAIPIYFSLGWVGAFLYAGLWLRSREQRMLARCHHSSPSLGWCLCTGSIHLGTILAPDGSDCMRRTRGGCIGCRLLVAHGSGAGRVSAPDS